MQPLTGVGECVRLHKVISVLRKFELGVPQVQIFRKLVTSVDYISMLFYLGGWNKMNFCKAAQQKSELALLGSSLQSKRLSWG